MRLGLLRTAISGVFITISQVCTLDMSGAQGVINIQRLGCRVSCTESVHYMGSISLLSIIAFVC